MEKKIQSQFKARTDTHTPATGLRFPATIGRFNQLSVGLHGATLAASNTQTHARTQPRPMANFARVSRPLHRRNDSTAASQ